MGWIGEQIVHDTELNETEWGYVDQHVIKNLVFWNRELA